MFGKILDFLDKPHNDDTYKYLMSNKKNIKTRDLFAISIICIVATNISLALFFIKYYEYKAPVSYQYNNETLKKGNYKEKLVMLSSPRVTIPALQSWTNNTINNMYNFDFNNFDAQLKNNRKFFTDAGYNGFVNSVNNLNLKDTIVKNKQLISLTSSGTPKLLTKSEGIVNLSTNQRSWQIEVPCILSVTSGTTVYKHVNVNLIVVLENENDAKSGLYIQDLKMETKSIK